MNQQLTPVQILEAAINNEILHATYNDRRLPPMFGQKEGEVAVTVENLKAAIEGAKKSIAVLPKEPSYVMKGCVVIGTNTDGSNALQYSPTGPWLYSIDRLVLDGWVLLGPKGAESILDKIKEDVAKVVAQ